MRTGKTRTTGEAGMGWLEGARALEAARCVAASEARRGVMRATKTARHRMPTGSVCTTAVATPEVCAAGMSAAATTMAAIETVGVAQHRGARYRDPEHYSSEGSNRLSPV
jgi:hypothetical protein